MTEHDGALTRRGFLAGASAAAAVGAGVVATGGAAAAQAGSGNGGGNGGGQQQGGQGGGRSQAAAAPPPTFEPLVGQGPSTETWLQPPAWRPKGDRQLNLRVVEGGNGLLFSYHGCTPGPTVRTRGDETVPVLLENDLGFDAGKSTVGPAPSPAAIPGPEGSMIKALANGSNPLSAYGGKPQSPELNKIPTEPVEDWCLGEHVNGVHTVHVTNLHTHGLHVSPGRNDDRVHSDNIYLRIVPEADYERMMEDPGRCLERWQEALEIKDGEVIDSAAEFAFKLGNTEWTPVHPPGTHWYHPHSHGGTHQQVASGMAGFFIIEGDVDDEINLQLAGATDVDPELRTGPWSYRERTMFVQRIINNFATDKDRERSQISPKPGVTIVPHVNGAPEPNVIVMRPNAIERWRILNGSVDGSGFLRVMVLKGRFEVGGSGKNVQLYQVDHDASSIEEVKETEWNGMLTIGDTKVPLVDLKQDLQLLAWDGVTLVTGTRGDSEYQLEDLSTVNGGKDPDFTSKQDIWAGDNPKLIYSRPNELAMTPGNRADVFFQAPKPTSASGQEIYTILGMPTALHDTRGAPASVPTIIGHIVVEGESVPGGEYDWSDLELPDVPRYLQPIDPEELEITDAERDRNPEIDGLYRTRMVSYAGWGTAGFPQVIVPDDIAAANPDVNKLMYYDPPAPDTPGLQVPNGAAPVDITNLVRFGGGDLPRTSLPPNTRTMNIDGKKFDPRAKDVPTMQLGTAEEWAVVNESIECWAINVKGPSGTVTEQYAQDNAREVAYYTYDSGGTTSAPAVWGEAAAYPIRYDDLADVNAQRPAPLAPIDSPQTGGADHPFHIHQNPFWLMRLEIPNNSGELINVLPRPQWADVTYLPRNGGRAIFRSRFVDFDGEWVDHCHILLHEDNGMMQRVRVLGPDSDELANYVGRDEVTPDDPDASTADIYPSPSLGEMWQHCVSFDDPNRSGQLFPMPDGWIPDPPNPVPDA